LPLGLRLETALSGISQLRNKIIGRIFKELNIIEQWGSGFERMIDTCLSQNIPIPLIEEFDRYFRVTIFPRLTKAKILKKWQNPIIEYLQKYEKITAKKAQQLWKVTSRTTSTRLKKMCDLGLIVQIATSPFDPQKIFTLSIHK
jgi:predicted HTH transcriptional regulator